MFKLGDLVKFNPHEIWIKNREIQGAFHTEKNSVVLLNTCLMCNTLFEVYDVADSLLHVWCPTRKLTAWFNTSDFVLYNV